MIPNNNLSILPFYSSLEKQNHRKDYSFGEVYALFTPYRKLLPFQIIRETRVNTISSIIVRNINDVTLFTITNELINTGLIINRYESEGFDVIKYPGVLPLLTELLEGQYYLIVYDGVEYYYSEVFTVVNNVSDYLKIEFWDIENLDFNGGRIDYLDNFKFNLYLPTQLGRPDYEFEEEVEKRDGYTFIEKQISEKTFKFNFLAPEFLCDAMRLIRMSDNVRITNKGDLYNADSFLMTPKWQEGGYLAAVEAEFQCDTVIKKIGKNYTPVNLKDFNNDSNNDFNTLD